MEFRVLGPLEVCEGERVLLLGGAKRRAVLAQLLLEANRVVSAERLIAAVWGDEAPESARAALQSHVSRLRRVLAARLETREGGYLLRVGPGELDLDRFGRLVAAAQTAEPEVKVSLLREALSLWRGRPLEDLAEQPVAAQAAHLEELYAATLEDRVEADLAFGRHAALVPELEALVEAQPFRERLRGQLIVALYRSGRQAEALEAYEAARRTLVERLGVEPGPQLQELQLAVLRQDSSLAPPAAVETSARLGGSRESRRLVTVLLADIGGGGDERDIEGRRESRRQRFEAASRPVKLRSGTVERVGSERLYGVFGAPDAHDDDALRAVQAAFEITSLAPGTRAVLATGEVIAGGRAAGEPLVTGDALDEAERLRAAGTVAGVLVDERTWRLVRHAVAGRRTEGGWLLERIDPQAPTLPSRLGTPLVGREHELAEIVRGFDRSVREPRPQLVTILGPPGIGKTRLELEAAVAFRDRATRAVGYCRAYGENGTYAPLADVALVLGGADTRRWITATMAGDSDREVIAERIAAAIGAGGDHGPPGEIAWAARRLFETLARTRPLVLVVEDAHWAAPAFLDLVDHLVDLGRGPIFVLALARPELLEHRPGWGGGTAARSSLVLEPLSDADAELLLARLEPEGTLDTDERRRVLSAAEGNPLFLEQLSAAAIEGGSGTVPDSIHALLAARLDRLPEAEREAVEAAAVCGTRFSTPALAELVARDPLPHLIALARREFVQPGDDEETWMFRHALIRDEAYRMVPKRRRAILHETFADSVDRLRPADVADLDLLVGRHLAEAVRCRRDLGETGTVLRRLAGEAGERLAVAGLRAFDRSEHAAAASLLGEAVELLPRRSLRRVELLLKLATALSQSGEREQEWCVLAEARELAERLADERLQALTAVVRGDLELSVERPPSGEDMLQDLAAAIRVLERAGDEEALALAHAVRAQALESAPRAPGWLAARAEALAAALDHARRAGSRRHEARALTWILVDLRLGTVPVPEATQRTHEILAAAPSRASVPPALTTLAILSAMQGAFDEARTHAEQGHRLLHELGQRWHEAAQGIARGEIEMMAADDAAAEALLREAYERNIAFEDPHTRANAAWRLALVLTHLGRDDEAERFVQIAAETTPVGGFWTDVWWRLVLASIDTRRGRFLRAQRLVSEGLALTSELEGSGMHVDAFIEAATTLRQCGRDDEAVALLERAAATAEALGYEVALRRAQELLAAPADR